MARGIMSRIPRKLPDNSNPKGTRCIQITIPDDDEYERDLYSVILGELTRWISWELDDGHNATKVAQVWKRALATFKHCDGTKIDIYGDYEEMPRFRDACDHDLFYQGCDDTEHQVAFIDDIPANGVSGSGAPQPSAGGGQQAYCYQFQANNKLLLPTLVNSGDVIELTDQHGAGNDGGHTTWYCPDGSILFGPLCVPTGGPASGDPMPGENHMSLIVDIGGTFYSLEHGPITVPGGVSNAQAVVQINDSDITNNIGSYTVCIKVTNNQIPSTAWIHTFDFALSPGAWTAIVDTSDAAVATWVAGSGWQSGTGAGGGFPTHYAIIMQLAFSAVEINTITALYTNSKSPATTFATSLNAKHGGATVVSSALDSSAGNKSTQINPGALVDTILFSQSLDDAAPGTVTLTKVIVTGTGTDPF
jgi:hypothetical protein